eukprot:RCo045369
MDLHRGAKLTTRELLLQNTHPKQLYGKQTVADANVQALPKFVKVDFDRHIETSVATLKQSVKPPYSSDDELLFQQITDLLLTRKPTVAEVFNQIYLLPTDLPRDAPQRITLAQLTEYLRSWAVVFSDDALARVTYAYQSPRGSGEMTLAAFSHFLSRAAPAEIQESEQLTAAMSERHKVSLKASQLASTFLLPTEQQLNKSRKNLSAMPKHGTASGLWPP